MSRFANHLPKSILDRYYSDHPEDLEDLTPPAGQRKMASVEQETEDDDE